MALIKCPECGREISEYADRCPGCGWPIPKPVKDGNRQKYEHGYDQMHTSADKSKKSKRSGGISAPGAPHVAKGKKVVHKNKNKGSGAGTVFLSVIVTLLILALIAAGAYYYFYIKDGNDKNAEDQKKTQIETIDNDWQDTQEEQQNETTQAPSEETIPATESTQPD